jgi:type I restriction enzyme S subunit
MEVRTRQQTIRPGYKQTEVGVIPEDWEIKTLGGLTTLLTNGFVGRATDFYVESDDGVLYVQGYNVQENGFNLHGICRVSKQFHATHQKSCLETGDLLTIQTGDIGVTTIVSPALAGANCHALVISRLRKEQSEPAFYCHYFNSDRGKIAFREIETGSTMKHLNVGDMVDLPLPCPSVPEQRAIAAALSDVDVLIASLDKLIVKKSDLKQAAMQQILTGKQRLPGFKEEWKVKTLPEVCWFQEGPGVRNYQFTSSGVKLLNGTNIENGKLNLDSTNRYVSNHEAYGMYSHFLADDGDIVIASSGITIDKFHEKVAFVNSTHLPLCMNTSTIRFKIRSKYLTRDFLFHFLKSKSFKEQIGGQATGSAQLNFGPSHVRKVLIKLPAFEEQSAIATVLSDMDAEINALEQRRGKTTALKQGMMQELLTGKTRLI